MHNPYKKEDPFLNFESMQLEPDEEIRLMFPIEGVLDIAPNSYYISSKGRLFSVIKHNGTIVNEVSSSLYPDGHLKSSLTFINSKRRTVRLDKLTAIYFLCINFSLDQNLLDIEHVNGNLLDSNINNIIWIDKYTGNRIDFGYKNIYSYYNEMNYSYSNYLLPEINKCMNIYLDTKYSIHQLALFNNCSDEKIERIKRLSMPFDILLYEEFRKLPPNHSDIPEEKAIKIYKWCKVKKTYTEIEKEFGVSDYIITDVKMVRGAYRYLFYKYGFTPIIDNDCITDEQALEIYFKLKAGYMSKQLAEEYGTTEDTITNIKFCRFRFAFLMTRYNLQPLERTGRS